jgi:hypothetical protein
MSMVFPSSSDGSARFSLPSAVLRRTRILCLVGAPLVLLMAAELKAVARVSLSVMIITKVKSVRKL